MATMKSKGSPATHTNGEIEDMINDCTLWQFDHADEISINDIVILGSMFIMLHVDNYDGETKYEFSFVYNGTEGILYIWM